MTFEEYREEVIKRLDEFARFWHEAIAVNEEYYPEEMDFSDWEEQVAMCNVEEENPMPVISEEELKKQGIDAGRNK